MTKSNNYVPEKAVSVLIDNTRMIFQLIGCTTNELAYMLRCKRDDIENIMNEKNKKRVTGFQFFSILYILKIIIDERCMNECEKSMARHFYMLIEETYRKEFERERMSARIARMLNMSQHENQQTGGRDNEG